MTAVTAALRAEFAPTGTLRVGLNMSNFLLTRTDAATGKPAGIAHDLALELARRLGLPVVFVPHPNPGALADAANKNIWDVGFPPLERFPPWHKVRNRHDPWPAGSALDESRHVVAWSNDGI